MMGLQMVVDGVADPREFKDYPEFEAVAKAEAKSGKIPIGAEVRVRRFVPPEPRTLPGGKVLPMTPGTVVVRVRRPEPSSRQVLSAAAVMGVLMGIPVGALIERMLG